MTSGTGIATIRVLDLEQVLRFFEVEDYGDRKMGQRSGPPLSTEGWGGGEIEDHLEGVDEAFIGRLLGEPVEVLEGDPYTCAELRVEVGRPEARLDPERVGEELSIWNLGWAIFDAGTNPSIQRDDCMGRYENDFDAYDAAERHIEVLKDVWVAASRFVRDEASPDEAQGLREALSDANAALFGDAVPNVEPQVAGLVKAARALWVDADEFAGEVSELKESKARVWRHLMPFWRVES